MIVATAVVALFFAVSLTLLFMPALGWPQINGNNQRATAVVFGSIVFWMSFVGGLWVIPIGPNFYGAPVVPMFVQGLLSCFLLGSLMSGNSGSSRRARRYYWLFISGLLVAVAVWYII